MKTLRIAALTTMFAAFGLMTGCDLFGSDESNATPTIKDTRLEAALVVGGGSTAIRGIISDDAAGMTLSLKVVNSAGADVTSSFNISYVAPPSTETSWSIGSDTQGKGLISAKAASVASSLPSGNYTLVYTVTDAAGASASEKVTFAVTGGTTDPTGTALVAQGTLSVGAQGATPPSFIGLGGNPAVAYTGLQSKTSFASIDLLITYDVTVTTNTNFESTAEGVKDGSLTTDYWGTGRATLIQDVGTVAPTTLEAAKLLLTGTAQKATIISGHVYVAKTVDGVYAVLTPSNISGTGNTMTLTVSVLK